MKNLIKIELSRALKNPAFLVTILIGIALVIYHTIANVMPAVSAMDEFAQHGEAPYSVFNTSLGIEGFSLTSVLLLYLFPILAVLAFADSFFTDVKSGYIKNVYIRTKKKNYLIAKFIAVFVSAGIAAIAPMLLSLFVTSGLLPSILPEPNSATYFIGAQGMWAELFYSNPYLYIFCFLALDFVFAGVLATVSLAMSFVVSNRFIVLLSPFVICIAIHTIASTISMAWLDTLYITLPAQFVANLNFEIVLAHLLVLFIPSFAVYIIKGTRNETY